MDDLIADYLVYYDANLVCLHAYVLTIIIQFQTQGIYVLSTTHSNQICKRPLTHT